MVGGGTTYSTRPRFATRLMNGTLCAGKMVLVKPGIRPVERGRGNRQLALLCAERGEPTHRRGTNQDACDDFGDDFRLAEVAEEEVEEAREGDNDEGLDDEEDERAVRVFANTKHQFQVHGASRRS